MVVLCCMLGEGSAFGHATAVNLPRAEAHPSRNRYRQTINLDAYIATLQQFQQSVKQLAGYPQRAKPLAAELPDDWRVSVQGQEFRVSTNWLRRELKSLHAHPKQASRVAAHMSFRLDTLLRDARSLSQPSGIQPAMARSSLEAILSRREFRGVRAPSWLDRGMDRVRAWFGRFLVRLFGGLASGFHTRTLLLWFGIGLLGLLLVIAFARALRSRNRVTKIPFEAPQSLLKGGLKTWRDWAREAAEQSAQGNFREAIHSAYWATLHRLAEVRARSIDPSRTPRENVALLAENAAERHALAEVTAIFELAWYSVATPSPEEFRTLTERSEECGCKLALSPATTGS
jgi:hypothetical protein